MKAFSKFSALALGLVLAASQAQATEWVIDGAHSNADFTIRHLVSKVNGSFKDFEGKFSFDPAKPETAKGNFTIQMASINTNNEKRDGHLKSPDFFDVAKFATATFVTHKTEKVGKDHFKLAGELTLHGVTKPMILDTEFLGTAKDPMGPTKAGFVATGKLNRKDYGISFNKVLDSGSLMLGEEVELKIQIEANAAK